MISKFINKFYIKPLNSFSAKINNLANVLENQFNNVLIKISLKNIFILLVAVSIFITTANYFLPYGCSAPPYLDNFLGIVSITTYFLVIGGFSLFAKVSGKIKVPYMFLLFIFYFPILASLGGRTGAVTKEYWAFSGMVEEKTSSNRNIKSITIDNTIYSAFPKHIWTDIHLGDVVSKKECSNIIKINKVNYKI